MLERIAEIIERHAMFGPGERVGVAVSGGADSVALLHILFELRPRWDLHLRVLHLDHRLRGAESEEDAQFVAELAQRLGLPAEVEAADVAGLARDSGDNLEQAARLARQRFFRRFLDDGTVDRVALGHTRSDQAETVLFRLLRGSGTAGLAGIRAVTGDGFARPLLGVNRAEVEEFLRSRGIAWREDSSNRDTRFDRNRIRHQLLPELRRDWNPALDETLANMATVAAAEEHYWETEMGRLAARLLNLRPPAVLLRCDHLRELPEAVARRLLRRAVREAKGDIRRIGFNHVEQMLDLARSPAGDGRIQAPGLDVARSFEWLRLTPPADAANTGDYLLDVSVPGRYPIPGTTSTVHLELSEPGRPYSVEKRGYNTEEGSVLDWGLISGKLELRNWRPGDRFQPAGHRSSEKMKILFHKARIPSWDRVGWPIINSEGTIIWTRRFGVAGHYAPAPDCRRVLRVWETGPGHMS